jgi:hypothetical protein
MIIRTLVYFIIVNLLALLCAPDIPEEVDYYVFNPRKCAELHNKILSIVMSGPKGRYNQVSDFFSAYEFLGPIHNRVYRDGMSDTLVEFLSLIDVARAEKYRDSISFTPHLAMPDPSLFYLFRQWDSDSRYPFVIQLYPYLGTNSTSRGGLLFDMKTNLVAFVIMPGEWPHEDQWYPLENALQKYLELFQSGRYHVSDDSFSLATGSRAIR